MHELCAVVGPWGSGVVAVENLVRMFFFDCRTEDVMNGAQGCLCLDGKGWERVKTILKAKAVQSRKSRKSRFCFHSHSVHRVSG